MIGRIFGRKTEYRASSTVKTNGDLALYVPAGESVAVAQAAASLWERAFMAAVSEDLTPFVLASVARALFRTGEAVLLRRGSDWLQAATYDIRGGVEQRTWEYDLELPAPAGMASLRRQPSSAVAHVRINVNPATPWKGRGPLQVASLTDGLMAAVEQSLRDEERGPVGQILAIPSTTQSDELANQIASLRGNVVLGESTAGGWDTGVSNQGTGRGEWSPTRIGPNPPESQTRLRRDVAVTVLAACGVPAGLVYEEAESGARESWRRFLFSTIAPIGRLLTGELSRVTGRPAALDWSGLFASDLAGRSRAYKQLLESGMSDADARRICGFD